MHGFFVLMGGFRYYSSSDDEGDLEDDIETYPLDMEDVTAMLRNKTLKLPSLDEIRDRSKGDRAAKTLVFFQTLWFMVQCLTRFVQKLPTSPLEIITLAHIVVSFGVMFAWWDKPLNVKCPIRIYQEPPQRAMTVRTGVDLLSTGNYPQGHPNRISQKILFVIFYLSATVFGAVHCTAWNFEFSSSFDRISWCLSSLILTILPGCYIGCQYCLARRRLFTDIKYLLIVSWGFVIPLYFIARITTTVVAFNSLASLPPGAFPVSYWASLIPHIYFL